MRLFVYEYLSANSAMSSGRASSLQSEGWSMLQAFLADACAASTQPPCTLLHPSRPKILGVQCHRAVTEADEAALFRQLASTADYSFVIAPESDQLLACRARWVREVGGRLLGSAESALELSADKLRLAAHWHQLNIPTPQTCLAPELPTTQGPWLCKPRHGAGSQATRLVHSVQELSAAVAAARAETDDALLVQPWLPGLPASVTFLLGPTRCVPLLAGEQCISQDGLCRYLGGSLPLPAPEQERALRLATRAVEAVPGLAGFVGVDLVLGDTERNDAVLEINPRLTTSYLGLRALCRQNLVSLLLAVTEGKPSETPSWHAGRARFTAAGSVLVS